MVNMNVQRHIRLLLFIPVLTSIGFSSPRFRSMPESPEKTALLPFEVHGLPAEEGLRLTQSFRDALAKSKRFDVMHPDTMMSILTEAGVKNLDECNYSYCLADVGKVLGVEKVLHASVTRRGRLYVLRVRLVNVADAQIVYDEKAEHSGEFATLAADIVPEQARRLTEPRIETSTKWYVIAAAVLVGVGAIYWIYRSFSRNPGGESSGSTLPPAEQ
jgi:hypothetical protein